VKNFEYVISEAQNVVARRYISALLQRRLTLKSNQDRRECANKICKEAQKLKDLFARIAPKVSSFLIHGRLILACFILVLILTYEGVGNPWQWASGYRVGCPSGRSRVRFRRPIRYRENGSRYEDVVVV